MLQEIPEHSYSQQRDLGCLGQCVAPVTLSELPACPSPGFGMVYPIPCPLLQLQFPVSSSLKAAKMAEMSSERGLWLCPAAPGRAAVPAWLAHGQEFIEILSSTGSSSLIKMPSYKLCFYKAYKIHPGSGLGIPTGPICCCLFIFLLIYQKSNRHRVLPLPCCCFIIEGGSSPPSPYLQAIRCCFKKKSVW